MKRSSSLVIIIPLIVVAIVIALVFVMRIKSKASEPIVVPATLQVPSLQEGATKPKTGFSGTTKNSTSPVSDLETDITNSAPTNDSTDIQSLQKDASSL